MLTHGCLLKRSRFGIKFRPRLTHSSLHVSTRTFFLDFHSILYLSLSINPFFSPSPSHSVTSYLFISSTIVESNVVLMAIVMVICESWWNFTESENKSNFLEKFFFCECEWEIFYWKVFKIMWKFFLYFFKKIISFTV